MEDKWCWTTKSWQWMRAKHKQSWALVYPLATHPFARKKICWNWRRRCIPRLLKGGRAACPYLIHNYVVTTLVDDCALLLINFNGKVSTTSQEYQLTGSLVIQFSNETVTIANRTYSCPWNTCTWTTRRNSHACPVMSHSLIFQRYY